MSLYIYVIFLPFIILFRYPESIFYFLGRFRPKISLTTIGVLMSLLYNPRVDLSDDFLIKKPKRILAEIKVLFIR